MAVSTGSSTVRAPRDPLPGLRGKARVGAWRAWPKLLPFLARLRDDAIYPNINRNNYAPTIYPPVAQMLFLLANRVGETVLAVKLVFVVVEAVAIGALLLI